MKSLPVRIVLPTAVPEVGTVVEVDGQDVTGHVRAFTLHAAVGELTVLTLELGILGRLEIDGVALVEAVPDDPVEAARRVPDFRMEEAL